jgi:hypothetical protein
VSAGRPPHLIAPDEVDAWLADSVVRVVTFHNTDRRSTAAILRDGARVGRSRNGSYGQGFYTATLPDPFHGELELTVAVRLLSPLVGHVSAMGPFMDRLALRLGPLDPSITPGLARQIRRELLAEGYDGIVAYDGGGDGIDYVIALVDEAVRIVVDR